MYHAGCCRPGGSIVQRQASLAGHMPCSLPNARTAFKQPCHIPCPAFGTLITASRSRLVRLPGQCYFCVHTYNIHLLTLHCDGLLHRSCAGGIQLECYWFRISMLVFALPQPELPYIVKVLVVVQMSLELSPSRNFLSQCFQNGLQRDGQVVAAGAVQSETLSFFLAMLLLLLQGHLTVQLLPDHSRQIKVLYCVASCYAVLLKATTNKSLNRSVVAEKALDSTAAC
eukprot:GHUV01014346.1.p1 GENE.GHUV01014346.1~~GHUV01014346.1.p1  ORF type:complete len:227 (-),score=26.07 GHUV01014346.1:1296-1976(-)